MCRLRGVVASSRAAFRFFPILDVVRRERRVREFSRAMYVCVDTRSKSVLSQGKVPADSRRARIESVRGDEPEVSLVRWLRFQCNCHGCKAGSVSWHAHLDVLCEKVGSPHSSHTVIVTELNAIFLITVRLRSLRKLNNYLARKRNILLIFGGLSELTSEVINQLFIVVLRV